MVDMDRDGPQKDLKMSLLTTPETKVTPDTIWGPKMRRRAGVCVLIHLGPRCGSCYTPKYARETYRHEGWSGRVGTVILRNT